MSTDIAVADWIKRIADDEQRRDAVRVREEETAARKAELVSQHGRRLLDELRVTVTRDLEAFLGLFSGSHLRDIVLEDMELAGFVVRKSSPPAVSLTVAPHLNVAALRCHYRFTASNGLPPREDRLELMFAEDADTGVMHLKDHGTGQVFTTPDALSEFLLVPVFTGRPR
ncbi:MAG: hypothetical protein ABJA98_28340 [Acidobacteriota bacterium]